MLQSRMLLASLVLLMLFKDVQVIAQNTCDPLVGQYELCQCGMSDGSGIIDLPGHRMLTLKGCQRKYTVIIIIIIMIL